MTSFYWSFRKDMMQTKYQNVNNLKVSHKLLDFVNNELLKDTGISPDKFWTGFDEVVHELAPKNRKLLNIPFKFTDTGSEIIFNYNNDL